MLTRLREKTRPVRTHLRRVLSSRGAISGFLAAQAAGCCAHERENKITSLTHLSLWPVAIALMEQKPAKLSGVIAASAPPAIITSAFFFPAVGFCVIHRGVRGSRELLQVGRGR